jgi:hypothetical protein
VQFGSLSLSLTPSIGSNRQRQRIQGTLSAETPLPARLSERFRQGFGVEVPEDFDQGATGTLEK